ncbi:hypothetical protein [Streptomyces sp. SID3343]|uniref:hypothetical protein n=1 Tax=Streptomyces sp. SID3343 TaxID=2690260 RepID=UPI00136DC897|nr:hypothetical protein [Streptomyces sp. SID3343]MYW05609.1 hypothetical protein [Streptomyces sp. SID3343]
MDYPRLFERVSAHPRGFGVDETYQSVAAFVNGCDGGNSWQLLNGFREWLVMELGYGSNLPWQGLVLKLALPDRERTSIYEALEPQVDEVVRAKLFELLEEFWRFRESCGLERIYFDYREFLGKDLRA